MYKALLKPREWLPRGALQCPSSTESQRGTAQVFLSPGENADISAAHQHWSPALPRLPRPGFVQGGQPARRSRSPMPQAGNVASPHVPKKAGRSLPAGTEPPSCVMETGRKTSTAKSQTAKIQKGSGCLGRGKVEPVSPWQQEAALISPVEKQLNGPQF